MTDQRRSGAPVEVDVGGIAVDRYDPTAEQDGPPLVMVHGAMDRAAGFRRTIKHLPNRRVLAYDRRGYGRRQGVAPAAEFADHLADLATVLELLDEPAVVVGHSFGGLIALWSLATPPLSHRLLGAVVWEAPMSWAPWYSSRGSGLDAYEPGEAAERFMRGVLGEALWERLPETMRAARRAEGPALLADLRDTRSPELAVPFERITEPVLVGHGGRSGPAHQRSAREMAAALPNGRLAVIADGDHGVHLSRPAAFARFVTSFGPSEGQNW